MENKVLIGSTAMRKVLGDEIVKRKPKDEDYLSLSPIKGVDVIDGRGILDFYDFSGPVARIDELYTLKVSHSFWDLGNNSWGKHIHDAMVLKRNGAHLIDELYQICYKVWESRFGRKNINLNQDKSEFFNGGVRRIFVHDSVHDSIAFDETPLFNLILEDGADVKVSQKKFLNLKKLQKVHLVQEEVMVLALERDIIPLHGGDPDRDILYYDLVKFYQKQLKLLITQYSKGWFPLWIVEHYDSVLMPPFDYWSCFMDSNKKILI